MMTEYLESKACKPCASSKRKCGKETPYCLRCRRRGIDCTYPISKPSCFVRCGGDGTLQANHSILPLSVLQLHTYSRNPKVGEIAILGPSHGPDLTGHSSALLDNWACSSWFNSPETWNIDPYLQVVQCASSVIGLRRLLKTFHQWLTEWVDGGSNPFIHSQLYHIRFPRCIQDAYTSLSCYLRKTASNEQIVLRIIEARATQLLAEYGAPSAYLSQENTSSSLVTLDSLEHLARVQALVVYQFLCLYDGDIRLRHVAESHIPVLNSWTQQMVEHASHAACLGGSMISSTYEQTVNCFGLTDSAHCDNLLWYSWILAESIRRTWLVVSGTQGTYLTIQQGQTIPCQGGMMITTRQGVWGAQSALAWEKLCLEVNTGLMHVVEADKLFTEAVPEDVDDFAIFILQATFGEERMKRWGVQIQD